MPDTLPIPIQLTFVARLVIAGVLAGVLGWEREHAGKPAGFRTHIAVGIGAALFTALSDITLLERSGRPASWHPDPTRVIQAIATGIGFLGSGIIFVSGTGNNQHVRGLTTAASIWATAAIAMACALGYYVLATGTTLLLLAVLRGLARFERLNGE